MREPEHRRQSRPSSIRRCRLDSHLARRPATPRGAALESPGCLGPTRAQPLRATAVESCRTLARQGAGMGTARCRPGVTTGLPNRGSPGAAATAPQAPKCVRQQVSPPKPAVWKRLARCGFRVTHRGPGSAAVGAPGQSQPARRRPLVDDGGVAAVKTRLSFAVSARPPDFPTPATDKHEPSGPPLPLRCALRRDRRGTGPANRVYYLETSE
jgi:hypothetical protein